MEEKGFVDENTIIEISSVTEDTLYDEDKVETKIDFEEEEIVFTPKKQKKNKTSKVKKEKKTSNKSNGVNKKKVLIIVGIALVILIAVALLLYFLVFKKEDDEKVLVPEENVVIEKDNYIYDNGKLKLLDSDDKVIGEYKCIDEDVDKCYVASLSNEDTFDLPTYVDEDENLMVKKSKIYNNRFVFIFDEDTIALYDIETGTKTGDYELIKTGNIDENLVVAKDSEENYGLLEIDETEVTTLLDFEYEYLGIISSSDVIVAKDGVSSFLVNTSGQEESSLISGEIKNFSENFISVYDAGYSVYNYEGEKVLEDEYDYVDFVDDYMLVIKNKKIFVYDSELAKINESGIKVKTNDYKKVYVFDKNNNLKETKKAYTVTINEGSINFVFDDETTKDINLYEFEINKTTNYVNYMDGTLYFYSDLGKTDLIGTYKCDNKNSVTGVESGFSNCMVAKDSNLINNVDAIGYIPIINETYAFIKDTKNGSTTETIVLYNFETEKKVKYQAVDTGISSESINHVSSINGVIAAKNNSGNMGIITIGNNGAVGLIAFQDSSNGGNTKKISYFKEYFLAERDNGNYLYKKNGTLLASSKFTIKDYRNGYLLVKDKEYMVHDIEEGKVISNGFDHVELFDEIFVGIKENKLNVYDYSDAKEGLIEEALEIVLDNVSKGYKLAIYSDAYVISIFTSENASVDYKYNLDWSKVENEEE